MTPLAAVREALVAVELGRRLISMAEAAPELLTLEAAAADARAHLAAARAALAVQALGC
jgi:hypothetical protein